jgi:hypothetical protein
MITNKTIAVTIPLEGDVKIEGLCFVGPDCSKAISFLQEELGPVKKRTKTAAYHQKGSVKQNLKQRL